ncbi:matrixin family metalloprotease [Dankookia rubra]|uniref:Matrixin family metalloprotease n=1 Tax=Dankookia rubra TaxID=1442381 RepID=A0A4R5QB21_9PROT|nr:matrixin family metalloprotease [Dankookia rubra]TDH60016.1 matrixin family metalloprotease [Dankookia rubra]
MNTYTLLGPKWPDSHITWSFANQTFNEDSSTPFSGTIQVEWQHLFEQAFSRWAAVSGLSFEEVPDATDPASAADIRIGWGDFGVTAGTIGEASIRYIKDIIQPDVIVRLENPEERPLVLNSLGELIYSDTGSSLYTLVLHEIGHALGLGHADDISAVMYPIILYSTHDLGQSDIIGIRALYETLSFYQYSITNSTTLKQNYVNGTTYDGPVEYLNLQLIANNDGDIVMGTRFNDFINTLGGDDAIDAGLGDDVLDGGTGSNFLVGGEGRDVFFLDGRGNQPSWSTISDWQKDEQLCIWGWRPGVSKKTWIEMDGLGKYRGVTLHADLNGDGFIDASVTWTGLTQAQLPAPSELNGLLWLA